MKNRQVFSIHLANVETALATFCAAFARLVNDAATAQSGETGRQAVSTALLLLPGRLHGRLLLVLHGRLAALGIVAALLLVASLRGTVGSLGVLRVTALRRAIVLVVVVATLVVVVVAGHLVCMCVLVLYV